MILYLLLFAIIIYTFTCGLIIRKRNILVNLSLGTGSFCCIYAVVSAMMFWVDRFSVLGAVIITVAIAAIADVVLSVCGRRFEWKWPGVSAAVPAGLLFVLIPLLLNQFDMYGMGQDEGVYQTKAIALMMGHTSNKYDFDEYHDLSEAQQEEYSEWLDKFSGFNNDSTYPGFYEEDQHCDGEGYFHGIPNVAALLALSGLAFGIGGMKYIFLLLYIATAFIIWETCNELGWRKVTGWITGGLFILSPIVLWVTKSSLTESLLTCVVAMLIYTGLLAWKEQLNPFFMLLPIGTFCFYHVSAFMMMPLFNAILLLMYLDKRDRRYWIANEISLAIFAAGFIMMLHIAPEYSCDNLTRIEILGLTNSTLWMVAPIYFILISLISVAVIFIKKKIELRRIFEGKIFAWILRALITVSLCYVGYTVYKLHLGGGTNFINRPFFGSSNYWEIFTYTTLFANCMMGGLLLLPAAIGGLLGKTGRFLKGYGLYITGIFVYIALLCNVFVSSTVSYYYYYDRYLEYVVPVSVLMGGLFMERLSRRAGYALGAVSAAVMIPFSSYILTNDDDSIVTNDVMEDIAESIEEDSAIIFDCSDDVTRVLAIDLRELTGARVYPVFTDYDMEKSDLLTRYSHVYILSDTGMNDDEVAGVYRNTWSEYVTWPDTNWCPLPMTSTINESVLYLYELDADDRKMDLMGKMSCSENARFVQDKNISYYNVSENGIIFGPYMSLQSGNYELIYDAQLPEGAELTLNITAESGQKTLDSCIIRDGENIINFTLYDSEKNVEFVVYAEDKSFCVTGIWLEKISDY